MRHALTAERLRDVLRYDPVTGLFVRLRNGANVGYLRTDGYCVIPVDGKNYRAHRLAWLWMTGKWPNEIDHLDGVRNNNRFSNLREASRAINNQNRRSPLSNNRVGLLGVSPERKGFRAQIEVGGIKHRIGTFPTPEEAYRAYIDTKRLLHPEAPFE